MMEKGIQVGPQDVEGSIKEVRQVHRRPTQMEEGRTSDRGDVDARPEEVSDVELHVAMQHLFQERSETISQGIPTPKSSSSTSPHVPLVLYQPPSDIFVKLHALSRFHSS